MDSDSGRDRVGDDHAAETAHLAQVASHPEVVPDPRSTRVGDGEPVAAGPPVGIDPSLRSASPDVRVRADHQHDKDGEADDHGATPELDRPARHAST